MSRSFWVEGAVKVKFGPVMLNYLRTATILERNAVDHVLVMDGRAKDARGNGTAAARTTTGSNETPNPRPAAASHAPAVANEPLDLGGLLPPAVDHSRRHRRRRRRGRHGGCSDCSRP